MQGVVAGDSCISEPTSAEILVRDKRYHFDVRVGSMTPDKLEEILKTSVQKKSNEGGVATYPSLRKAMTYPQSDKGNP